MALTLLEAAKHMEGQEVRQAMIEIFASETDLLRVWPFMDIQGNALKYTLEAALPGIAFRGVNEGYNESTGVINPQTESVTIAGGDLDVDNFILDTMGQNQRSSQESMKLKALSHAISHKLIKGDSATDPREFDGLQKRLTGTQLISNSAGTGAALSLANLDAAIDAVNGPQYLFMSKALRRLLTVAARTTTVGGNLVQGLDQFGRQIHFYNGLPILEADRNNDVYATLGFNEAAAGGGSASTSIYVLSFGDNKLTGIQSNGLPKVRDLGELQTKPTKRSRVEWYPGIAIFDPYSASRVYGITNAAVVA